MISDDLFRDLSKIAARRADEEVEIFAESSRLVRFNGKTLSRTLKAGVSIRVVRGCVERWIAVDSLAQTDVLDGARQLRWMEDDTSRCLRTSASTQTTTGDLSLVEEQLGTLVGQAQSAMAGHADVLFSSEAGDLAQEVQVINAWGCAMDLRTRSRLVARCARKGAAPLAVVAQNWGCSGGPQALLDQDKTAQLGELRDRAHSAANSGPSPEGPCTVVFADGTAGVFVHEACGHPLEGDQVLLGSVFADRVGSRVTDAGLTVVNQSRRPGGYASAERDDEGQPTSDAVLLQDGICTGLITDRHSSRALSTDCSGSARRESFATSPLPRMSNLVVARGSDDPRTLLSSTRSGLYVTSISGQARTDPLTGAFALPLAEAWVIDQGELVRPVRGGFIVGDSLSALRSIDGVGGDHTAAPAVCRKGQQNVDVMTAAPTLRVRQLRVALSV
ncbi:TldD/PmbA family protein [Streptomyces sp. NPDC051020]|uniref:TldD/PmbA family protein n=1 Tax=Streptomyces sp. NPDC051020 TaxID=3155409 RepID=UPI0034369653